MFKKRISGIAMDKKLSAISNVIFKAHVSKVNKTKTLPLCSSQLPWLTAISPAEINC